MSPWRRVDHQSSFGRELSATRFKAGPLHVANLLDAVFSFRPKAVAEVGKNSGFRSGRRRLVRKLVPMTTQLCEPAAFDRRQQIELGRRQAVQQGGDSRGDTYGQ